MTGEQLKSYLKEDIERIEKVLEESGGHRIWRSSSEEIRCAPPFSENHTAVSVHTDTLYCTVYQAGETWNGDILGLVQKFRDESFSETFRFVRSIFGLSGKYVEEKKKIDPLASFKKIRKKSKIITSLSELDIEKFNDSKLDGFVMMPHISLFKEGITPQTAEHLNLGFDPVQSRIIFPHYNYDSKEDIVGITGRTTYGEAEMQEFKIPKYFNYIKGYKKMYNLYGFSHSLPFVIENGMLVIFEAEKSVAKLNSMTRNKGFGASTGGHVLSDIQVQIILKYTPPDTEIVIAYDSDVMRMMDEDDKEKHIGEQYLIDTCHKVSKYRKTSYVYDKHNILGDREAPIDRGVKIWNHLLKYRKEV